MKKLTLFFIILSLTLPMAMSGRKKGYRLPSKETAAEKKSRSDAGTFRVLMSDDSLARFSRRNIIFSGFEKKLNSSYESFFITNLTDHTILAVELSIEYLTPDGRQLNRKFHRIPCSVPPGETRPLELKSWDTQHAFYYIKSVPKNAAGTPFIVKFSPLALTLKY